MPGVTRRKLDQHPTKEELEVQGQLLTQKKPMTGYGVPKHFEAPKAPDKPADLDGHVAEWLEGTDFQAR